jgi:hypothetical protein
VHRENSFEFYNRETSKEDKLRRNSAFTHRETEERSVEVEKPLRFQNRQSSGGTMP